MKFLKKLFVLILIILIIGACLGFILYKHGLSAVEKNSANPTIKRLTIEDKMYVSSIAKLLKENGVIRSEIAMKIYAKINNITLLQAGKYDFNLSEDTPTIIEHIANGDIASDDVTITFIEGKNMRWYANAIAENTTNTAEDVFELLEDEDYIDSLIEKYWFLTDEIKDDRIYYPLEGYLLPDTYSFETNDVSVKEIFSVILNYTDKYLTSIKDDLDNSVFTVHQLLTMASITELEGKSTEDRAEIIGVFYNRLRSGMSLGSDVTTYYAFKVDMGDRDLTAKEINTENPYNTRGPNMAGKIPVGPIGNPSKSAIEATVKYTETSNFYFVADKTGKVYFTKTYPEHQNMINRLKKEGLWYTY